MAFCLNCGTQLPDGAQTCPACGAPVTPMMQNPGQAPAPEMQQAPQQFGPNPQFQQQYQQLPPYMPPMPEPVPVDPKDHTAEFSPEEISKGKVFALACYLLGFVGFIITYLGAKDNKYAMFHARQALLLTVADYLALFFGALLAFLLFIPLILACIFSAVLSVVSIIMIIQVIKGKAKEAPIVGGMKWLN